jgi:phosphoserine phosphatase
MSELEPPLYVDLDGSLVECDTLKLTLRLLLQKAPYWLPLLSVFALTGKARFKRLVSRLYPLDPGALPYRQSVINFLTQQRQAGRYIVLATGADQDTARRVATHLALFDEVIASDGTSNQTGYNKLSQIRLKTTIFDYIGDSKADFPIFREARKFYIVRCKPSILAALPNNCKPEEVFE